MGSRYGVLTARFPTTGLDNVDNVPYTDVLGMRRGPGSFWRGEPGNGNWFHVSIPTPVIVGGDRVALKRVFVKYSVGDPGAFLANEAGANAPDVQGREGSSRIQQFGPFPTDKEKFGDHRGAVDEDNTFVLPSAPIGLIRDWNLRACRIRRVRQPVVQFAAAGAEFESQSFSFNLAKWLDRFRGRG